MSERPSLREAARAVLHEWDQGGRLLDRDEFLDGDEFPDAGKAMEALRAALSAPSPEPGERGDPTELALVHVGEEVARARAKFPRARKLTVALMEEVGELAQAQLQQKPPEEIRKEAMQVAAVAVRIMTEGDADFIGYSEDESMQQRETAPRLQHG